MAAADVYENGLAERALALASLERKAARIVRLRLATFVLLIVAIWLSLVEERGLSPWWILVPLVAFGILIAAHVRVRARVDRCRRSAGFYAAALERARGNWRVQERNGERFRDPHHPYADDLDLFGEASLFQRLNWARTLAGEDTLAGWLLAPADPQTARARRDAAGELAERVDLRAAIAVQGAEAKRGVESERLRRWVAQPPVSFSRRELFAAAVAGAVGIAAIAGAIVALVALLAGVTSMPLRYGSAALLAVSIVLTFVVGLRLQDRVRTILGGVAETELELDVLRDLLALLERTEFRSSRLRELMGSLSSGGEAPSKRIARLERLLVLLDSAHNQIFLPIALLVLWHAHVAFAIERWRSRTAGSMLEWVGAIGEIEALVSIGAFSFENPDYGWPRFEPEAPRFEAAALGHPLLPPDRLVRNDVALGSVGLLLVSGSNMSGKSTLLRSVGVAAVLAFAGAPVCADALVLSPLHVGASIRLHDSLQEGASRFWAEIQRLRQLLEIARGEGTLLFLLDEILGGTNSHDRRIGAEVVLRSLLEAGAIGLVTTHDLALTEIQPPPGVMLRNVHFEDRLEEGEVLFDYRMREGVVSRSNALELMRMVGLVE